LIRHLLAVLSVSLLIFGSRPAQFLNSTIPVRPNATPTPLLTIRVISYNVLFGAGVDRQYDDLLPAELRNKNRLPGLVSFIDGVKPGILGIQEANGWNTGSPLVVEQVAEQLEMNDYYLAEAPNDFHVVLFTKFKITEAENLSGTEGDAMFETMRALRATLLTPDGQSLHVFVVHFDPFSTRVRLHQVEALIDHVELYKEQGTIILGDMNFCVHSPEYATLARAGWKHIALANDIDQIWISPIANWSSQPLPVLGNFAREFIDLSDHLPVGAEISMYPGGVAAPASTTYPYADQYSPGPDC
jgi:endonuclease/exonuclease/phosphatase family metal-dependent hydrolase